MAHFQRTALCPAGEIKVGLGSVDFDIPETDVFPVDTEHTRAFEDHAAATGFYLKVDDDPTEADVERANQVQEVDAETQARLDEAEALREELASTPVTDLPADEAETKRDHLAELETPPAVEPEVETAPGPDESVQPGEQPERVDTQDPRTPVDEVPFGVEAGEPS